MTYHFNAEKENAKTTVLGSNIHAVLKAGVTGLLETRESLMTKSSPSKPIYTKSIGDINIATAAITLLYTDTTLDEGYLGDDVKKSTYAMSVNYKHDRALACMDLYPSEYNYKQPNITSKKAARNIRFNDLLSQRIDVFSSVVNEYDLPIGVIPNTTALGQSIASPMFHEKFHHSEQALMHYISGATGMAWLAQAAISNKAAYLYGIVLDIYTQRTLCCNCNSCLIGMQHSHEQGFLNEFTQVLAKHDIKSKSNFMLSTRVSASKGQGKSTLDPLTLPDDKNEKHSYNPDNKNEVLQAVNETLGTQSIINKSNYSINSYQGAFFLSSTFSKKRLETMIKDGGENQPLQIAMLPRFLR